MLEEEIVEIVNKKVLSNSKIYEFIKDHNEEQELDFDTQLLGGCGAAFDRKDYILLLQLGVPIGVVQYFDEKGTLIVDEDYEPIGKIRHFYKPINSLKEYFEYMEIDNFPYLTVNPKYMSKKEVRNLLYCLTHSNNDEIFDFYTKNQLQLEILDNLPLKYDNAMRIFNKYYDESIQRKFIYEHNVSKSRFYYLSGLNELVKDNKNLKEKNKNER